MQFLVNDVEEYANTIQTLLDSGMYINNQILYMVDMIDGVPLNAPHSYPCIVSMDTDELDGDNRSCINSYLKFIYIDILLTGKEFSSKINELKEADLLLAYLIDQNVYSDEYRDTTQIIENLEMDLM